MKTFPLIQLTKLRINIMANTEVLLLEAIKGLGSEGDAVSVRAGYARNFLLPRKLATPINQANKKQIEALLLAKEKRLEKELEASKTLAEKMAQLSIVVQLKLEIMVKCLAL